MSALTAVAIVVSGVAGTLHPDSMSSSRVVIDGREARVTLRCQVLSLLEVIDGLDADGDGEVTAGEVLVRQDAILGYVGEHYQLRTGTDRDLRGGVPLAAMPVGVTWGAETTGGQVPFLGGRVDCELVYVGPEELRDILIEVSLFHDTSPDHVDFATIEWPGRDPELHGIVPRAPRVRSDPSGRGAFAAFLRLGFRHILEGWDHLAFVLALVLVSRRLRSLLLVVTAFTAAHSVTLALSALGVIDLSAHGPLIEAVIALSIAYVAVDGLVHPKRRRSFWLEAFLFGLVHGLGFAGFLGESLVNEAARGTALLSFNVGVELGQVAVVVAAVVVLRCLPRGDGGAGSFLAPRPVRTSGLIAIAALGFWWFFERL